MRKIKPEIKTLKVCRKVMLNNVCPGYPYQDSIIIDFGEGYGYDHSGHKMKKETLLNSLYAKLLYQIVGHTESQKGSRLYDKHISKIEHFTNSMFDIGELYIDSDLAARFYLAIQSALCDIHDNHKDNAILWACIDANCDYIDCKVFTSLDEIKAYQQDYFWED